MWIAGVLPDTLEDTTTDKVSNLCSLLRDYTAEGDTAWYLYEHDVPGNAAQVKRYYAEHLEDNWAEKETGGSVR